MQEYQSALKKNLRDGSKVEGDDTQRWRQSRECGILCPVEQPLLRLVGDEWRTGSAVKNACSANRKTK